VELISLIRHSAKYYTRRRDNPSEMLNYTRDR